MPASQTEVLEVIIDTSQTIENLRALERRCKQGGDIRIAIGPVSVDASAATSIRLVRMLIRDQEQKRQLLQDVLRAEGSA